MVLITSSMHRKIKASSWTTFPMKMTMEMTKTYLLGRIRGSLESPVKRTL